MQCNYQLEDAFDYLDGELDNEGSYRQHIDDCSNCQSFLADVSAAREVWKEVANVDLDGVDWNRLDQAVNRRTQQQREEVGIPWLVAMGRGLAWAGAVAALVLVSYIGLKVMGDPSNGSLEKVEVSQNKAAANEIPRVDLGQLVTAGKTPKTVQVADARLEVGGNSVCRVSELNDTTTIIDIVAGSVTFDVAPRQAGSVFQVRTANINVTVVGTRFTVAKESDGTVTVSVEHGLVDVQRGGEAANRLSAGDAIRMAPSIARHQEAQTKLNTIADRTQGESVNDQEEAPGDTGRTVAEGRAKVAKAHKVRAKRRKAVKRAPSDSGRSSGQAATATKAIEMEAAPESASKDKAEDSTVAPTPKRESTANLGEVEVHASQSVDPAVDELKTIFKRISQANASGCILELHGWLKRHPKHRKRVDARYAMGYCEFQRGNVQAANRIFAGLPKGNRWIRKVGDYLNPPKPR